VEDADLEFTSRGNDRQKVPRRHRNYPAAKYAMLGVAVDPLDYDLIRIAVAHVRHADDHIRGTDARVTRGIALSPIAPLLDP